VNLDYVEALLVQETSPLLGTPFIEWEESGGSRGDETDAVAALPICAILDGAVNGHIVAALRQAGGEAVDS
jgi:hypothetical protein